MAPQATEQGKDCVMCKVFELGWCKTEFEAFDSCYDATKARGAEEQECMPLFDRFRQCMHNKMAMQAHIKAATGGR